MTQYFFIIFFVFSLGCAKQQSAPINSADTLTHALIALPQVEGSGAYPSVEVQKEAGVIAKALVDQTGETNKEFKMSGGPKWHNFKIKMGAREKGYCYEWVPELLKALPQEPMKYYERHWGGSFMSMGRENNAVIITKRGAPLETGIVYDAWRGVGQPFWIPVAQDKKYQWEERFNETQILGGEAKVEPQ
ncbi:MAG: hypothetical protein Q8P84_06945 [Deltaproteobacteria bacterium]|nr:hypothetical protein [Deltaproteobacteria bacterium]